MNSLVVASSVLIGLVIGNLTFFMIGRVTLDVALERSFFQVAAVVALMLCLWLAGALKQ